MIYNRQHRVRLCLEPLEDFASELGRSLKLGRRWFDITFIDDREIRRLNREFRRKNNPTDVLSFPWAPDGEWPATRKAGKIALDGFLGDVIISAPMARRDAAQERVPLVQKLCQLVSHGVLHLVGYDHETDNGEMQTLESDLRRRLRVDDSKPRRRPLTAKPRTRVKVGFTGASAR